MKRFITILGVLLAGQLILAVFLNLTNSGVSGVASSESLLHFTVDAVDKMTIEQSQKTPLVVARQDKNWYLPILADFPASASKIEGFLNRVAGLRKRLPISTTMSALSRFKVSPAAYEHKLILSGKDKTLATLWLGDSAGLRQVYARANEEETVYNLDFATYEVTTDPNQWADKTVLNLKADEITQVTLPDVNLIRIKKTDDKEAKEAKDNKPGTWQVTGLAPGEEINTTEIDALINRLANLSFDMVLGKENQEQYRQDAPVLTIAVTMQKGETRNYIFSTSEKETPPEPSKDAKAEKAEKKDGAEKPKKIMEYILKSSASPYYFKMADFMAKELIEAKRDKLVKAPNKAEAPATSPPARDAVVAPVQDVPQESQELQEMP